MYDASRRQKRRPLTKSIWKMCFRSAGGVFALRSNLQRILSSERGAEIFVSVDIVVNAALDCEIIKIGLRGFSGRRHSRSRIFIINELAVFK